MKMTADTLRDVSSAPGTLSFLFPPSQFSPSCQPDGGLTKNSNPRQSNQPKSWLKLERNPDREAPGAAGDWGGACLQLGGEGSPDFISACLCVLTLRPLGEAVASASRSQIKESGHGAPKVS